LGFIFYSFLILFNPKKLTADYGFGESAVPLVRLVGSFVIPIVLIGIYLLFTSIEGAWVYFVLVLLFAIYQLAYDLLTRMGVVDSSFNVINKTQDTILSIVFIVVNLVILNGLQDRLFI
jgi:hypothetical protein